MPDLFSAWFIPKMDKIGYDQTHIHSNIENTWINFKAQGDSFDEQFHVMYLKAPMSPEAIRQVFTSHNEPVLFVVDEMILGGIKADIALHKSPALWFRALHAIFYGRVYTWNEPALEMRAMHAEWDKWDFKYSEPLDPDGILFTDTDCKLRDFPGLFHIARFYDRAFWKEQAAPPPPKRERKGPRTNSNEQFWRDAYAASDEGKQAGHREERKQKTTEDVFRDFREAFERNKRQYQSQHYDTPYVKQNVTGGDKWLQGFISTGNLATARVMYKRLAKEWHPDLNPGKAQALETMQAINSAFERAKEILV